MTTAADFLAAIIAQPKCDATRLIFADWLEENGEPERAEFIRVQCELAKRECVDVWCEKIYREKCPIGTPCEYAKECDGLRRRERELLDRADEGDELPHRIRWLVAENPSYTLEGALSPRWSRGFVSEVTCRWSDWQAHHEQIRATQPVTTVRLTTWPQTCGDASGNMYLLDIGHRTAVVKSNDVQPPTWEGLAEMLVKATWPGIDFVLPVASPAAI